MNYACAECDEYVHQEDTVWIEPHTGEASVMHGDPFHVECAPSAQSVA